MTADINHDVRYLLCLVIIVYSYFFCYVYCDQVLEESLLINNCTCQIFLYYLIRTVFVCSTRDEKCHCFTDANIT